MNEKELEENMPPFEIDNENEKELEENIPSFEIDSELRGTKLPRTIRFPEALFEKLSEAAQQNNVSLNRFVLQCCKFALEYMKDTDIR